jgi:hypothetical protein
MYFCLHPELRLPRLESVEVLRVVVLARKHDLSIVASNLCLRLEYGYQGVDEGMGQPRFMQRLVGIGDIESGFDEAADQESRGCRVSLVGKNFIWRLTPDVPPAATILIGERSAIDLIICQHTERRDDILPKVLVLVISPDEDEVGMKRIDLGPDLPETGDQPLAMRCSRGESLVLAILRTHRLRPAAGVFHLRWHAFIPCQRSPQRERPVFIRGDEGWIVRHSNTQYLDGGRRKRQLLAMSFLRATSSG